MATGPNPRLMTRADAAVSGIDVGLRQYMLRVYNYMTGGLALTGIIAYVVGTDPTFFQAIYGTPAAWVVMFAPFAIVLAYSFGIQRMSAGLAQVLFWAFAALMGLSLSYIFVAYAHASIARVFFITAGTFAGMSLYGYTTKRDLTGFGSFLFMGLLGLVIAMLVNMFLHSAALDFALSVIGVLIFTGLTAYDTQSIKEQYSANDDGTASGRKAVIGALRLYLDFVNLFLMLLRLFGRRR